MPVVTTASESLLARGDAQALVFQPRALVLLGPEHLVAHRVEHDAGAQLAIALERDRDREVRDAVQEVERAVERIDDEAVRLVRALHLAAFLEQEAVARPRLLEALADDLFGLLVGGGDEVGGTLARDLQVLDLAEIADEAAPGGARGIHHDGDGGGGAGHRTWPCWAPPIVVDSSAEQAKRGLPDRCVGLTQPAASCDLSGR